MLFQSSWIVWNCFMRDRLWDPDKEIKMQWCNQQKRMGKEERFHPYLCLGTILLRHLTAAPCISKQANFQSFPTSVASAWNGRWWIDASSNADGLSVSLGNFAPHYPQTWLQLPSIPHMLHLCLGSETESCGLGIPELQLRTVATIDTNLQ